MDDLIERIENVLKLYENDVVEFPKWELREAADALRTLSSENKIKDEILEKLGRYLTIFEEIDKGNHGATTQWILRCDMRRLLSSVSDIRHKKDTRPADIIDVSDVSWITDPATKGQSENDD